MDSTSMYQSTYTASETGNAAASAGAAVFFGIIALFYVIVIVVMVVSLWRLFKKAGKPGWAAIVPIYNQVVMLEIAGRPIWWLLLIMFVPFFGWWVQIVSYIDFAKSYDKSTGFGVLVALVPLIGFPMLAFGNSTYTGPIAAGREDFMPAPDRQTVTPVGQPQPPVQPQA